MLRVLEPLEMDTWLLIAIFKVLLQGVHEHVSGLPGIR